jgi:hypothetical protein
MKIHACVRLGQSQITQKWDLEGLYLIIKQCDSGRIALKLAKSNILIIPKVEAGIPPKKEQAKALVDSFDRVYSAALNLGDAILLPIKNSN